MIKNFFVLLAALLFTACSNPGNHDGLTPSSGGIHIYFAADATAVPVNSKMLVDFGLPMDPNSFTDTSVYCQRLDTGALVTTNGVFADDNITAVITFPYKLLNNTTYRFTLTTAITYADGTPLQTTFVYEFTTASTTDTTAPIATSVMDLSGRNPYVAPKVLFNEYIDTTSVSSANISIKNSSSSVMPSSIKIGNNKVMVVPSQALIPDQNYTLTVSGVKDLAGNSMSTLSQVFYVAPPTLSSTWSLSSGVNRLAVSPLTTGEVLIKSAVNSELNASKLSNRDSLSAWSFNYIDANQTLDLISESNLTYRLYDNGTVTGIQLFDSSNIPITFSSEYSDTDLSAITVSKKYAAYIDRSLSQAIFLTKTSDTNFTNSGVYTLSALGTQCRIDDNRSLAVVGTQQGFEVVNISTTSAPVQNAVINNALTVNDLQLQGQKLYILENNITLKAYDLSNPSAPTYLTEIALGANYERLKVAGSFAYLSSKNSMMITMIDLGDPTGLHKLYDLNTTLNVTDFAISAASTIVSSTDFNGTALIVGHTNAINALQTFDISSYASTYQDHKNPSFNQKNYRIFRSDTHFVVAGESGIEIFKNDDLSHSSALISLPTSHPVTQVARYIDVSTEYLVTAQGTGGVIIYQIVGGLSAPSALTQINTLPIPITNVTALFAVVYSPNYRLYIASATSGLSSFDLTNPAVPVILKNDTSFTDITGMAIKDAMSIPLTSLYLAHAAGDISVIGEGNFSLLATITTAGKPRAMDVDYLDYPNYLFISEGSFGVEIYDIFNSTMHLVKTPGFAMNAHIMGPYVGMLHLLVADYSGVTKVSIEGTASRVLDFTPINSRVYDVANYANFPLERLEYGIADDSGSVSTFYQDAIAH